MCIFRNKCFIEKEDKDTSFWDRIKRFDPCGILIGHIIFLIVIILFTI